MMSSSTLLMQLRMKWKTSRKEVQILLPLSHYTVKLVASVFQYLYELKTHQQIHSGESALTCEICGECFKRKYSLTKHLKIHSGLPAERKSEHCYETRSYRVLPEWFIKEDSLGHLISSWCKKVDEDEVECFICHKIICCTKKGFAALTQHVSTIVHQKNASLRLCANKC
ncbi:zinc finger protein 599-like [Uloborus diversus]|uniref:zinc finger protein 599-like n=1 Tax=Uloborus diversus TaxID=327109 RepID=UPI00240A5B7A|nr:zinc finger protein 599-like [Uloborus diversus]